MSRSMRSAALRIVLAACLSSLAAAPAPAGLIGYWSFDGCSTTDASGNNATLDGHGSPTCVAGRFGNAWALNGSSDYLDRPAGATYTPGTRAWSVAAWARTSSSPALAMIVEWYRCGASPGCNQSDGANYILSLDGGHAHWSVRDDGLSAIDLVDSTANLANGAWHFLVGTFNPATDSTRLYVDGTMRLTSHQGIGSLTSGSVNIPLEVGRHFRTGWGVPDYYFPGTIDEVRIYDNELSAASVASLFTNNAVAAVAPDEAVGLSIEHSGPNPVRGDRLLVAFTLPVSQPASLTLFDVGGRSIEKLPVGSLGAGRHEVELGRSHRLSPGIYLIRLAQGRRASTRRVTVLD